MRSVQLMDEEKIRRSLARITHEIIEQNSGCEDLVLLGVKTKGIPLAKILHDNILRFENIDIPCGELDVTMHRDDYSKEEKLLRATDSIIPCDLENKIVIIVDDVLYTGRTARAAIETVFSFARPKAVKLAVLVDRGHREIPIRPDFVGKNIPTSHSEKVVMKLNEDDERGVYIISE